MDIRKARLSVERVVEIRNPRQVQQRTSPAGRQQRPIGDLQIGRTSRGDRAIVAENAAIDYGEGRPRDGLQAREQLGRRPGYVEPYRSVRGSRDVRPG